MNSLIFILIFICGAYPSNAGYYSAPYDEDIPQSDVQAPAYVPSYMKNRQFSKTSYRSYGGGGGTKTGYSGTKTGYAGTKTGYAGTKTGYSSYTGTKTWASNTGGAANYEEFQENANRPYQPLCEPECKNSGICVDTNTCHCAANFHGKYCETERKPCLTLPPQPANSKVKCSSDLCQVSCLEGHKFFDGSTVANLRCAEGQWVPTRADLTSLTDCLPECSPSCLNGGVCLSVNTCQCPQEYRGPQCQYSASQCDAHKLAFNGGYSCAGDGASFSCQLSCPPGSSFSTPPADVYTCLYSTGIFQPKPIPHCVFNEVVIITPSNYHHTYNETYYETSYHNRTVYSGSHTKHTGQTEIEDMNESTRYSHQDAKKPYHVVIQELTPTEGTCLTWAGAHYKTFDGKIYSFLSPCQHVLFRDAQDHKLTVSVKHRECKSTSYCPSELSIFVEDKEYFLSVGEDGTVVFRSSRRLIPVPAQLPRLSVVQRDDVIVTLGSVATLTWDTNNLITIEASVSLWNNTEGLCGRLDGSPADDFLNRDGSVASTKSAFVASWQVNRVGDTCDSGPTEVNACVSKTDEDMRKAKQFCTKVFSKDKFRKCSAVMDVSMLLNTCQWDYCACTMTLSPEECACKTVAVYAKECQRHGVDEMKLWRDADTCPMHCPDGKIYKSCGPESQPTCAFPLISSKMDNSSCVEGCFCPEGLLLEGGKCVPKSQCTCRLRKKAFPPGATVKKDCNTCTCDSGEWVCTKVPCGARCAAVGDPHYTTFDGLRYDFMGHCSYNMLSAANLTIEVENVACSGAITEAMNLTPVQGSDKPSCTKSVTIEHGGATVHLKQGGFVLVNGKEIQKLPVHVGETLIRAASSLFIIVQLPNGVDVWWDGNTRVYIDVPAEFQGKTKGLCGTFNLNQKDDFLTPEGDVEQSTLAFANKWKTREACADLDVTEPEHPCKAHVENKEAAEKYCGKLKSKLFEPCHWYVDVTPYYEACMYDMCACEGDASQCVCAAIADYAAACAPHHPVHWRYEVKECELSCSGGQEYTVCADSCLRTCADVSLGAARRCRPHCVEGCACPAAQVLDDTGSCVPVGLCPCFHKGLEFKPGYKEVRPGRREREICTCIGARWDCQPASPQDIQNYPPAEDLMQNCTASHHMEFTTCMATQVTCKNMHLPPSQATAECRAGCQCVKGYVLDMATKTCVLPETCPCHHGGESYPDSHTITEECNTCTCKSGNWSCTQRKCEGVCAAWGDSHIATFDGNEYDFEGVCSYLLAKGCMEAGKDGFEVEIQNEPCGTTGATCSKSVTLKVGGGDDPEEMVRLTKNEPLPEINKLKRIKMRLAGSFVFLDVSSLGMSLQWDRAMRVYVKVDAMWQNRVKGLCGNYNSDMRDDFQTPTGGIAETSALIFADSWKLKTTCPKPRPVTDHCQQRPERKDWASTTCGVLKHYPFTLCHSEVPPSAHIERCARDACACDAGDDCACACAAIATYAHACVQRGVVFKWRTKELCPMQCDEECSNYEACISPCPPETCDNTLYYEEVKVICEKDTCVEGCKLKNSTCPPGLVFSNSSLAECVPRQQCRPVCMTTEDGKKLLEGELIEEDACHTCRCSKNEKVCTGQPCPTDAPTIPPTEWSPRPHDEALKCVSGWTGWVNQGAAETTSTGSMDVEPLPKLKDFQIGSPMCKPESMKKIECRTVNDHRTPKDTGLNVECSLEKGLICKEMTDDSNVSCPDFEIRVYCECEEEPFQCLNSTHPNYPHPSDCTKFYECIPDAMSPERPHAVLKTCGEGLLYNPEAMVCDWPAAVVALRPECRNYSKESREFKTTVTPTTVTWATGTVPSTTPRVCPSGQVYKECAFPCDKLCDHFKKTLADQGKCLPGQKCIQGCVDEAAANIKCDFGSLWRDEKTCVPIKDCTCLSNEGKVMKPGATSTDGCIKCQCLDNVLHCDSSECVKIIVPMSGSTHEPYIFTTHTIPTTTSTTELPSTTEEVKPTTAEATSTTVKSTTALPSTTTVSTTVIIVKSTSSPPPFCSADRYKNLLWDGEPLPDSSFTASSVANALFEPQFAVLNGHPLDITAGSWNPSIQDLNQFIQVELPQRDPLYGVLMQGSPLFDQYVTSYEVMYGDDGHTFATVKGPEGENMVFRGPTDHNNPIKQMFNPPIEAKFVRIHPLTWHDEIAVRWELIGCEEHADTTDTPVVTTVTTPAPIQCTDLLGLSAGLPTENIEVSSNTEARKYLDLTSERGWTPLYSTPGEWLMFDFTAPRNITGIKTKGGQNGWVTSYNIMYTSDLTRFNPVIDDTGSTRPFPANFDKDTVVVNEFRPPIHARYLKVLPMKWKDNIEMRIEPVGCFEPYPTLPPTTSSESPLTTEMDGDCLICPGFVRPDDLECSCDAPAQYYDGENCVSRDQCPCFVGYMSYAVGSTFRGDSCDECVCKLGGVTDCKPVKQCDCAPNLVPNLSPTTCECTCKACPADTKICPTSKLCLPLDKWCDGLQDCPDDERNCTVPTTITTTVEPVVVTTVRPTVEAAVPTTVAPKLPCPVVECPPGYTVQLLSPHHQYSYTSELPPPRARRTYARFFKGQTTGVTKRGYSKGGFSKGGYSNIPSPPKSTQAFTLDKPQVQNPKSQVEACQQFKCVPKLPPYRPGVHHPPQVCSTPQCPPKYKLQIDTGTHDRHKCPQYVCVPPPDRPVYCELTGRTFNTFDGSEYKYDVCFHILARDNRFDAWTVLVRKKCRVDGCLNELLIRQDDQLILIKPDMTIEYDNYEYTVEQTSMICFQKNSFDLARLGTGVVVKSRKYNFTVAFNTDGDVKVGVSKSLSGSVDGLCGYFDGVSANDRRLPSGRPATSVDAFGRAWAKPGLSPHACQTKVIAKEKQQEAWSLCDVVTKEPLSRCGSTLNLDKWRSMCLEKICTCSELVVNGTRRSQEECRCLLLEQFVAECRKEMTQVDLADWRTLYRCPAECPAPLVHYSCYQRVCEPACSPQPHAGCPTDARQCVPGCYCPEGTLRLRDSCVAVDQCLDCNCNSAGNKYMTFEGDDMPFEHNCTYLVSRDRNDTGVHKYQVYATNGPCEKNNAAVCTKVVQLLYEKHIVRVEKKPTTKKLQVMIDEEVVFKYPQKKDWVTISLVNGQDVKILLPAEHVELTVSPADLAFSVKVPSSLYSNATQGLCGVCAGYQEHLVMSNGTVTDDYGQYAKSWQAKGEVLTALKLPDHELCDEPPPKEECVPPPLELNPCNKLYDTQKFGACHALVDPASHVENCEADLCTNNTDICTTLERYAAECRRQGVCLQWRGGELCPWTCKSPFIYRPCVGCDLTCDNYDEMKDGCGKPYLEGCYCPEGKVRVNNTCIEPTKCFPCDSNKEHYAGDEWQEDACTSCSCSKLESSPMAHITCNKQTCSEPVCADNEDLIAKPAPGACCREYVCVPKPIAIKCDEPKQIECGFGQVLKLKTKSDGCTEFACECKPANECDPIPPESKLEPGMTRDIDSSGCCPKEVITCRKETCPPPPECPNFHHLTSANVTGVCCLQYTCQLPSDKCLVTLEWEAAPKGGEKLRAEPETLLKDIDEAWLDGPCRSCRCSPPLPSPSCLVSSCPPAVSDDKYLVEPRPAPFACCPAVVQVACRDGNKIYKVGEKWSSAGDVCEHHECVQLEDGKLDKLTTVQMCDTKCQPGWQYIPTAPHSGECCGQCAPRACVVDGAEHEIGSTWTSLDHCTNYTCMDVNGTLQVQSSDESCPSIPDDMKKLFVFEETVVPGKCCKSVERVACRDGDKIYQEGQTWNTSDPCITIQCVVGNSSELSRESLTQHCAACGAGFERVAGGCCGHCRPTACLTDDGLRDIGATWTSADNCTTFSCLRSGESPLVSSSRVACPRVDACPPEDLANDTCCQICKMRPQNLKPETCKPEPLPDTESVGIVRRRLGAHGLCANINPLPAFRECRGSCTSGTLYNNQTGSHDSRCECCQAVKYESLLVTLQCEDGTAQAHRVASPSRCACRACGEINTMKGLDTHGYSGIKSPKNTGYSKKNPNDEIEEIEIPEIYKRFGEADDMNRVRR